MIFTFTSLSGFVFHSGGFGYDFPPDELKEFQSKLTYIKVQSRTLCRIYDFKEFTPNTSFGDRWFY